MKSTVLLLLLVLLFSTSEIYAQRAVPSGSIQITSQQSETLQVEISGLLSFRENISGNLLLSNLIPGEYRVLISGRRGSRITDQRVHIQPGQRAVISISANNRVSVTTVPDPNSSMLHVAGGGFHPSPMRQPISDADLNRMLSELERIRFDNERRQLLEVSAAFHHFTSAQFRQILLQFRNYSYRLRAAQMLISRVIDPQNLYLQADVFRFQNDRNSFLNLIREKMQDSDGFILSSMMQPISDADLSRMLSELGEIRFDNERRQLLEVSAIFHLYTSAQFRQILLQFRNYSYRLRAAQMLILHVIDPQNLYLQADVFRFQNDRNNFLNLIREQMR